MLKTKKEKKKSVLCLYFSTFDNNRVRLEHLTDCCLTFQNREVIQTVIVQPIDVEGICLRRMLSKRILRASLRILSKIVV